MERYTIGEVASKLSISKDTLRYYDKIGILSPTRHDNKYRYYGELDLKLLMYIQVMKYAQFSLDEIRALTKYDRDDKPEIIIDCNTDIINLLEDKKQLILKEVIKLSKVTQLIDHAVDNIANKEANQSDEMDRLVLTIFNNIKDNDEMR